LATFTRTKTKFLFLLYLLLAKILKVSNVFIEGIVYLIRQINITSYLT
jgi:hypothetical protein